MAFLIHLMGSVVRFKLRCSCRSIGLNFLVTRTMSRSVAAGCKVPVHVEIAIKEKCPLKKEEVSKRVGEWLQTKSPYFRNGNVDMDSSMESIASKISVVDLPPGKCVSFWQAELCFHPYRLSMQGPENDFLEGEEELPAAEQWELPNSLLNNLWGSIVIDNAVKARLLSYCSSSIRFSEARIDTDIISWNRMILLHGPPGTGKTTICKGLAQKTFIRNSERFSSGILLEVNSHSLFSKWFSESGKLVMKLFAHIAEIAEDEECMVVVLIDEVESITASRGSAARSNEPGDAVRVVNAVLTSLDALKRRPNVLVLCTSNLIASVDPAFLDRVDMKVHLGPPPVQARYNILHSCLVELMQRGIIAPQVPLGQDCAVIEEQLLQGAVGSGSAGPASHSLPGDRKRAETLQAVIDSVTPPALDDGGIFSGDIDEFSPVPGCSPPDAGAAGGCAETTHAQSQAEMYWADSQEEGDDGDGASSSASMRVDEPQQQQQRQHARGGAGRDGDKEGDEEVPRTACGSGTALEKRLSVEQYLYVVAALCQGMSGRALRKLPIKAHAYYLQRPTASLMEFIAAMHATIVVEKVTGEDLS